MKQKFGSIVNWNEIFYLLLYTVLSFQYQQYIYPWGEKTSDYLINKIYSKQNSSRLFQFNWAQFQNAKFKMSSLSVFKFGDNVKRMTSCVYLTYPSSSYSFTHNIWNQIYFQYKKCDKTKINESYVYNCFGFHCGENPEWNNTSAFQINCTKLYILNATLQ